MPIALTRSIAKSIIWHARPDRKTCLARGMYHPFVGETRGNKRFMPKTTDKRTAARRAARVQRAHTTKQERTAVRRRPPNRRSATLESSNIFARFPAAFIMLFLTVVAVAGIVLYANHLWIFTPKPPAAKVYPALPASAAASPCQKVSQYVDSTTPIPDSANINRAYTKAPPTIIDKNDFYCVGITTTKGFMLLELDPRLAPNTVNNFVYLADHHYYDNLTFHRVERVGQTDSTGQVSTLALIQGGSPDGTPSGTPGYSFNDELNQAEGYVLGTVAMANSGPNTNGSQFFIDTGDNSKALTKHAYNLFGHLVKGIDTAVNINAGDKMIRVLVMAVPIPPNSTPPATPAPTPTSVPTTPTPTLTPTPTPKP
jgi:cyclophilin family peptidyl-prolyl cis-trans isomerase